MHNDNHSVILRPHLHPVRHHVCATRTRLVALLRRHERLIPHLYSKFTESARLDRDSYSPDRGLYSLRPNWLVRTEGLTRRAPKLVRRHRAPDSPRPEPYRTNRKLYSPHPELVRPHRAPYWPRPEQHRTNRKLSTPRPKQYRSHPKPHSPLPNSYHSDPHQNSPRRGPCSPYRGPYSPPPEPYLSNPEPHSPRPDSYHADPHQCSPRPRLHSPRRALDRSDSIVSHLTSISAPPGP